MHPLKLKLEGIAACKGGEEDVALLLAALRWLARQYRAYRPPEGAPSTPPTFTSKQLARGASHRPTAADLARSSEPAADGSHRIDPGKLWAEAIRLAEQSADWTIEDRQVTPHPMPQAPPWVAEQHREQPSSE